MSTNSPTNSTPVIPRFQVLRRPPGVRFDAALAVAAIAMFFFGVVTSPCSSGVAFVLACLLMAGWLWIGARWFFSLLCARGDKSLSKWRWAPGPFVVIVVLCAGGNFDICFAFSRPAMEAYVARAMAAPAGSPLPAPGRIGFVDFGSRAERLQNGVRFFTFIGGGLFDEQGLAWSTTPLPKDPGGPIADQKHYVGNWYKWWGY